MRVRLSGTRARMDTPLVRRVTVVTGRGRTVVIRAQAERLPMTVTGIETDEEAPLPREAA